MRYGGIMFDQAKKRLLARSGSGMAKQPSCSVWPPCERCNAGKDNIELSDGTPAFLSKGESAIARGELYAYCMEALAFPAFDESISFLVLSAYSAQRKEVGPALLDEVLGGIAIG
jgi:hypothetical protein